MKTFLVSAMATLVLSGCMMAESHRKSVTDDSVGRMTVGKVQKEIRVGMSGAEVAQVLGSPNIVSTDEQRREVWIYDKISTEEAYSASSGGVLSLFLVGLTEILAEGGGGASGSSGASSTSQKTLTVIIKFDENKQVRDFAYHASRF